MTKEQAAKSGLKPINGAAGFRKMESSAAGPFSAIVRYIRKGGDIYLRTTVPMQSTPRRYSLITEQVPQ